MVRRSLLCFGLAALTGCALHDWSSFSTGPATVASDAGAQETSTTVTATDAGDAGLDAYEAAVETDGPISWFRFEEPSGATTITDVAKKYTGAVQTTAYFGAPGVSGHGVQLDGSGGFNLGDVFDFAGRSSFTLEAWIKTTSTSQDDQRLMFKRDDTSNAGYVLYLGGDLTPHFEVAGAATSSWSDMPISRDVFTHVVVTVTYVQGTGSAMLWANGQKANHGPYFTTDAIPDTPAHFDLCAGCRGTLDEVAFYDKSLSDARILAHYLAGTGAR